MLLPAAEGGVELVAKFFRALGDPARLRLLEYLLDGEHTVTECTDRVGLSQGRVSAHLACLAGCGYVQVRRSGRFAYHRVADRGWPAWSSSPGRWPPTTPPPCPTACASTRASPRRSRPGGTG